MRRVRSTSGQWQGSCCKLKRAQVAAAVAILAARDAEGARCERRSAASLRRLASATGGEITLRLGWQPRGSAEARRRARAAQPEWEKGSLFRQSLKLQEYLGAGGGARGVAVLPGREVQMELMKGTEKKLLS